MEKSVSLFNLCNVENVLQRNLRTRTARECIFRASGGTRFKNFHQPCCQKGEVLTPRCNRSAQKHSGHVTVIIFSSNKISLNLSNSVATFAPFAVFFTVNFFYRIHL